MPFPCSFHTSWLQNIRLALQVIKNSSSLSFFRGSNPASVLGFSGSCCSWATGQHLRRGPVLRRPSAQYIFTDSTSPTCLAPGSGPKRIGKVHVLYLKINKAIWKTQSKIGVEVPIVSIYSWDVAIFCCTFDLLQKRKGSLEVTRAGSRQCWPHGSSVEWW